MENAIFSWEFACVFDLIINYGDIVIEDIMTIDDAKPLKWVSKDLRNAASCLKGHLKEKQLKMNADIFLICYFLKIPFYF